MRAIIITSPGGPDVLRPGDVATPVPGSHEIRVRVHAAGVNRADLLQRRGRYPAPAGVPANVPGLEYAGVVDALGSAVRDWRLGDRVMGLVAGGAYAEAVIVREGEAVAIPEALSFEEAAALPEAFMTAHDALHARAGVHEGDVVLIHAAASGVGTAAVQLASALGCTVIGTARSAWKLEQVRPLGLDIAIDTTQQSFVEVVSAATGGRGADVIIDLVGGDYLGGNVQAAATLGRIVLVGLVAGRSAPLDMGEVLRKRITLVGTVMRSRSREEKIEVAAQFAWGVLPLIASGRVRPVVDRVVKMEAAAEAHAVMEANENVGKVVLVW